MASFKPMTPAQWDAKDVFVRDLQLVRDLPLLDDEFDEEPDFHDAHLMSLEVDNSNLIK